MFDWPAEAFVEPVHGTSTYRNADLARTAAVCVGMPESCCEQSAASHLDRQCALVLTLKIVMRALMNATLRLKRSDV